MLNIFTFRGIRAHSLLAFKYILEWQADGPPEARAKLPALLVTAAAPWFLNSLHSTYDDRPASRQLMAAILPHVRREDADRDLLPFPMRLSAREPTLEGEDSLEDGDAPTVPYFPFGLIFLREIHFGEDHPVPRFYNNRSISDGAFEYFFQADREEVELRLRQNNIVGSRHPDRTKNRTRQRIAPRDATAPLPAPLFSLARSGHRLLPPARDYGSDMEASSEEEALVPDSGSSIDKEVDKIWRLFLIDIMELSPNQKGANLPAYIKLGSEVRKTATLDIYQNERLSELFIRVQWKRATKEEWKDSFDRLFPGKREKMLRGKVQNFGKCAYYPLWVSFMDRVEKDTLRATRKAVWGFVCSMYWLPCVKSDRIWCTRPMSGLNTYPIREEGRPAPQVLIRPGAPDPWWA